MTKQEAIDKIVEIAININDIYQSGSEDSSMDAEGYYSEDLREAVTAYQGSLVEGE